MWCRSASLHGSTSAKTSLKRASPPVSWLRVPSFKVVDSAAEVLYRGPEDSNEARVIDGEQVLGGARNVFTLGVLLGHRGLAYYVRKITRTGRL